ncbi:MOSC domain-containing protein [Roseobacter sp. OBYS 0001]|uniref:MOSC domain-containing protein n=1 Tax=Roseobacter sp. OBYS 0001 TaxID=882651 RepID=UPI001BBA45DA|nr:MOSC domain-containing protein [Roseobacter sp. OBYS 0001]GIT88500.1 molybdenum cofactor sulfurase [Roseobacter sp. OBYS 0001]
MDSPLKALIARHAQLGAVTWIGLRPARRAPLVACARAEVGATGLTGDHGTSQKRAVTLLQAEHLPVIGAMLGRGVVTPEELRRNLVISGINLAALKNRQLQIGDVVLEVTGICAPCSRMEEILGPGGYSAVRGHGGWCARVLQSGQINCGDAVMPLTSTAPA